MRPVPLLRQPPRHQIPPYIFLRHLDDLPVALIPATAIAAQRRGQAAQADLPAQTTRVGLLPFQPAVPRSRSPPAPGHGQSALTT